MVPMQHSIAARYAARPSARFVRPSARPRERRLGLRSAVAFQVVPAPATVLHRADLGPLLLLRASWRSVRTPRTNRPASGRLRPVVTMRWARPSGPASEGRSSAASAPWLA